MRYFKKKSTMFAGLIGLLLPPLGVAVYVLTNHPNHPDTPAPPAPVLFRECAREVGITFQMDYLPEEQGEKFKTNIYDHGCGVAIGDYDGDGLDDIYFVNQLGKNALYRNKGDGTFEDVTEQAGVAMGDRVCVAATFADYDNDGHQDLFVTSTRGGNKLFRNNGKGQFEDVTEKAGLTSIMHAQTAVFFDYDNDGYLDLFVTNTAEWTVEKSAATDRYFPGLPGIFEMAACKRERNLLYHNNRDGTFTDVTEKAGLAGKGWGGDVAVFDYNDDGHLDLLVTNMFGASQLYRNNGDGTFTDVTRETLGRTSFGAIGCKVFDFNNDGRLDLLIVDMHSDMWLDTNIDPRQTNDDLTKKYPKLSGPRYNFRGGAVRENRLQRLFMIHYDEVVFGNTLYENQGQGKFEEVSAKANMETFWPWGIATGDFDNDGYEDVFLPSGMGFPYGYWPNALMMNNGNGAFTDQAEATGIEPPRGGIYLDKKIGAAPAVKSSRCAAVADFEGKGRLSLVVNNFNGPAFFFRNEFPKKNYAAFRLQGTKSNRDAIGALVKIFMGQEVMVRQVQGAGGYLSQSSRTVHFGLGERSKIDRVEIRWPSGIRQTIFHPDINKLHDLIEPDGPVTHQSS
jgi:enediyne biosynthesis protein E4